MNILFLLSPKINISYLNSNMTLRQGLEKFKAHGFSAVPVLDEEGRYIGTVTEGDFLRFIINNDGIDIKRMENVKISDIIRADFNPSVSIDASLEELIYILKNTNFAPVVDGRECFVGIVTRKTLLEYLEHSIEDAEWKKE